MKKNSPLFAFFGHHKGATGWMNSILAQVCYELKLNFSVVHYPEMFNGNLKNFVEENEIDFLSYDNADYEHVKQLEEFRAFHVIRDPRDITISAYYSHLYSHGLKGQITVEQRQTLQDLSKSDGLLYEMQCREQQFKEMNNWNYTQPNVLEIRMEELTANPYKSLISIFNFLGLVDETSFIVKKRFYYCLYSGLRRIETRGNNVLSIPIAPDRIPAERLLGIIWDNDFSKKARGREPGQENVKSHYRKGTPGDWINHYKSVHYDYFREHYNSVLLKLGYEQDPDWMAQYLEPISIERRAPQEQLEITSAATN